MLRTPVTSRKIAYASVFAVVYSITRLFPVSAYVGISSTLTLGEAFSPLSGILFGPYVGPLSIALGTYIDFILGRPIVFDGLDFLPGVVAAIVAGFCFTRRKKESLVVPLLLMALFTIDPLSTSFIRVASVEIPFLWMHVLSVLTMAVAWVLLAKRNLGQSNWLFIAATVFISTMSAHVAGSVLYENVLGRINMVLPASSFPARWEAIFYLYPVERVFFTVVGTIVAIPVLKALRGRTRED